AGVPAGRPRRRTGTPLEPARFRWEAARVLPAGGRRVPPQHFVAGGTVDGAEVHARGVAVAHTFDADPPRSARRRGELAEQRRVERRDAGEVVEVHEVRQVAVGLPVALGDVLVLAAVVLARLAETDRRPSGLEERPVIAAAPVAVAAEHELDVEACDAPRGPARRA